MGTVVAGLNRCGQACAAAADHHHIVIHRCRRVAAFLNHVLFTGGGQRAGNGFFQRFTLGGRAGDGVHVRAVRHQDAAAQAFEGGGEVHVQRVIRHQNDVGNTVGIQRDVDFQLQRFGFHFFLINAGFVFAAGGAGIADHRIDQREAPQRLRNVQRFAFVAVDIQFKVFVVGNAIGPVRIGDAGLTDRHQVKAMFQRAFGIFFIHHATDANHRHFGEGFRAHGDKFCDQRRRIFTVDDGGTQQLADGEVHVIQATRGELLQEVHGVIKANAGNFQLFWREAIADNKRIIREAFGHFMGDFQHFQRETGAIIAAAAPLVVTLVRVWGVELLDQIGIRAVDFHAVEAGFDRAVNGITKFGDHHIHFFRGQRLRRGGPFTGCGDGTRRNRRSAANQLRLNHSAAVVNLQNRFRAFGLDGMGNFAQAGNFVVAVDSDGAGESRALRIDKTAFHDHRTNAASTVTVVLHQLAGHGAIVKSGAGGHRCHQQAVFQHRAVGQSQGIQDRGESMHYDQLQNLKVLNSVADALLSI